MLAVPRRSTATVASGPSPRCASVDPSRPGSRRPRAPSRRRPPRPRPSLAADEFAGRPLRVDRTDDAGPTASERREDQQCRRLHLEVHDALARHVLGEVRVADGQLRDRAPLRTEEPGRRGRDPDVGPMAEPLRGLDEGDDRLVVGDRRIPVVDEEARGRLEADRPGRDDQVAQAISGWSAPHDPTRMKVGRSVIARISATTISTLSVPMPVDTTETRWPAIRPRDRRELAMPVLELDRVEARGDTGGPVRIAGEEDVLGQFAWAETDVVLPFSGRDRNAAIPGASTRVSAFGKTAPSLRWLLRWRETRPRIVPPSRRASSTIRACVTRAQPCVARAWAAVGAVRRGRPRLAGGVEPDGRGPREGRETGRDAGSETAPRLPPPEACDRDRESRDRRQLSRVRRGRETRGARRPDSPPSRWSGRRPMARRWASPWPRDPRWWDRRRGRSRPDR